MTQTQPTNAKENTMASQVKAATMFTEADYEVITAGYGSYKLAARTVEIGEFTVLVRHHIDAFTAHYTWRVTGHRLSYDGYEVKTVRGVRRSISGAINKIEKQFVKYNKG